MLEIDLLPPEARDRLAAASGQHPQAHDVERLAVAPVLLQLAQGFAEAPYFFECEKSLLVIVGFLDRCRLARVAGRSEEHTSELQCLMPLRYAVFALTKKTQ